MQVKYIGGCIYLQFVMMDTDRAHLSTKLVKGEGIRYESKECGWLEGCFFLKGKKVGATYDIQQLMKEGKECEDKWGRDHGNGWLLRHPLKKMYEFQQYLLQSSNDV